MIQNCCGGISVFLFCEKQFQDYHIVRLMHFYLREMFCIKNILGGKEVYVEETAYLLYCLRILKPRHMYPVNCVAPNIRADFIHVFSFMDIYSFGIVTVQIQMSGCAADSGIIELLAQLVISRHKRMMLRRTNIHDSLLSGKFFFTFAAN